MKIHKTHIWLFIFVFSCFFVLGITSAFAIDSSHIDRSCSLEEIKLGTCLEIKNKLGQTVYIVKAVTLDNGYPDDNAIPGGNWPKAGAYSYWGGATECVQDGDCLKPSAWSYIVFDLKALPIDAEPPGAQLPLDSFSCGDATISPDRFAYKLNPSVNFKGDAIFTLYYDPEESYDACSGNKAYVLFGKECSGGLISPPEEPRVETRRFECSTDVAVVVQYDKCTGVPFEFVQCELAGGVENMVSYSENPWLYADADPPDDPELPKGRIRVDEITNMGPAGGTVLCTDSDPVFLWGNRAYWCVPPPE